MKLFVMTDIHLYSKRNWLADPYKWDKKPTQMQLRESEEIIREAFDIILADPDTNTVLITGDLTDNGEITSHEDLLAILKEYQEKGLRILLTTSTHDYRELKETKFSKVDQNKGLSYGYDENYNYKPFLPCARRDDLRKWYAPYGMDGAYSTHEYSMSYTYDLDEKHRLLAINDDYITNRKNAQRGLFKDQINWILEQIEQAHRDGKTIVAFTHHPVIAASPVYKLIGSRDIIADNNNIANMLADNGVNVIYTGHSHIHNIGFHKSEKGNPLYDISTGALVGYPPVMRKVEYRDDGKIDVQSIVIQSLKRFDLQGKSLPEYCREGFFGLIEDMVKEMGGDFTNFAIYANSISIRPWTVYQFWWIFKAAGKFINNLTVGTIYKWCKKESGLSDGDVADIKDQKVVPIILNMVQSLYAGNANFSPDGAEFSIIMSFISILDDLVKTLGINLKKMIGYGSIKEIVEPLVYNNGIDDYNALISPSEYPKENAPLPEFKSNKGVGIIICALLLLLVSLPITLPVGLVFGILIALRGTKLFNPYRDYKKVLPPRVNKKK